MPDSIFKYCPLCAAPLVEQSIFGNVRPVCPRCGFVLFLEPKVVTVVVVQYKDRLLLGKRNINPGKGLWSFFGGYVDRGEKVEEAALREVKEETNVDVQLERLIGVYSKRGEPHILIAYQASMPDDAEGTLEMQPEEVSELAFFSWEELPVLAFPSDYEILHDLQRLNGY